MDITEIRLSIIFEESLSIFTLATVKRNIMVVVKIMTLLKSDNSMLVSERNNVIIELVQAIATVKINTIKLSSTFLLLFIPNTVNKITSGNIKANKIDTKL